MIELIAKSRDTKTKSGTKQIRRQGNIPAILYSPGSPSQQITIDGTEFDTVLRKTPSGMLSTQIFQLSLNGKKMESIIKEVQYGLTDYKVIHLDFEILQKDVAVQVKVPISLTGVAECAGVKLGGFINPITRWMKVKCLPKDIPQQFEVDVRDLGLGQSKRLSDIVMPKGVKALTTTDEIVVIVARAAVT
ncbi:MAG: 50S ribosomal protein L25/general stress protein Ctc [Chlamydiae bacterium]|nr:50S ribosomal protein L25/general stress protein Ctc [Chlamydiota bacterium]